MIKNDLLKTFEEFYAWLQNKKSNQLSISNSTVPKRIHIVNIDLSSKPNSATKNGLFKIPTNFTGVQIERFYSTDTGIDVSGNVRLIVDNDHSSNIQNSKTLYANDSFSIHDGTIATGYLDWDLQPNVSVQIAFFIDIDYRAGSTKTSIVGTVTVQTPASSQRGLQVTSNPTNVFRRYVAPSSIQSYSPSTSTLGKIYIGYETNGGDALNISIAGQSLGKSTLVSGIRPMSYFGSISFPDTLSITTGANSHVYLVVEEF